MADCKKCFHEKVCANYLSQLGYTLHKDINSTHCPFFREKLIPKKPKERHSVKWGDSYNDGECPTCGATYSDSLSDTPLYCSQCGQEFDWSDKNA